MACQLIADCLNEIFEYLEGDKLTLYSCLLVNRHWCELSVRILWSNSRIYSYRTCNTLISCLPNESKLILSNNGIIISTPTLKPPMFNYAAFCKDLSISSVEFRVEEFLKDQKSISSQNLKNNANIVSQEILKLFVNQIP